MGEIESTAMRGFRGQKDEAGMMKAMGGRTVEQKQTPYSLQRAKVLAGDPESGNDKQERLQKILAAQGLPAGGRPRRSSWPDGCR